jgi:signal transduction histidine kinase
MNALIDDVLTLSATQATQQCSPCPTDLLGFCRTLWEEAQLQSCDRHRFCFYFEDQRQNLVLTAMPSDLTLDAYFDPKLLYPALTNLLSNAIKYSPEGREIHFRCVNTLEEIQFQVQDQGIGIPASEQARLFSTFYRASNVGKIPGSGLGLSIVKQSIQLHQGTVRCDSQVNQGSTFTISIPVLLYFI